MIRMIKVVLCKKYWRNKFHISFSQPCGFAHGPDLIATNLLWSHSKYGATVSCLELYSLIRQSVTNCCDSMESSFYCIYFFVVAACEIFGQLTRSFTQVTWHSKQNGAADQRVCEDGIIFLPYWKKYNCTWVTKGSQQVLTNTVETLYSTIYYSKYFIELNLDKSTQYVALWTHKRHPIPRPFGRAMECLLWVFQQKLTVL